MVFSENFVTRRATHAPMTGVFCSTFNGEDGGLSFWICSSRL